MTAPSRRAEQKSARGRAAEKHGRWAEVLCLARLRLTGWRIIAHRLAGRRGTGLGEIDIIAARGKVLAFIEVKARGSAEQALEAVGPAQRQRIQNAALSFLAQRPDLSGYIYRFDAMTVSGNRWPTHIPDAWRVE